MFFFSFPFCELTGEALNPRAGHTSCVAVCSPMCKFTYTFPPLAYYSDNNEPFPYSHSFLKALLHILLVLPTWTELPSGEEWGPCHWHPQPKKADFGVQRQPGPCSSPLSFSWPEAAPSPEVLGCCNRISPLLTALDSVFLGTALPKTLENRKQLKALLASFLASAPPFLSWSSLWIK